MKEFYFSKKRKTQVYMIITTMLLCISACAFSNFDTYADGVSDYPVLSDLYEFNDGILYSDDIEGEKPKHMLTNDTQDTSLVSFFTEFMNLGCPINPLWYEQQIYHDATTYPCYLFVSDGSDHITFVQLPENSFIVDAQIDATNSFYANKSFYIYSPTNITDHCVGINSSYNDSYYEFYYSGTTTIDGETLYYAFEVSNVSRSSNYILNTNMPIHVNNDEYNQMIDSMDDVSTDINYGNSTIEDGENSSNNLYFKDCDISYSCTGNTNGNVVCQAKLTDYQKEHLDEFLVVYNFTFDVKGYRVNNDGNSLGDKLEFSKNYSYQQSLSDFYNNSSSKVFTLKDIEQNINTTDITADGWGDGWPGSEYGNLYQLFNYMNNNLSSSGNLTEGLPFKYIKCSLKTTMYVTLSDVNLDNITDNNIRSGSYSESYNFINGTSSLNSDGILNNSNPIQTNSSGSIDSNVDLDNLENEGGITGDNMPSSNSGSGNGSGSGTGVVTGDNNIVINNNPTNNVSGGGGYGTGTTNESALNFYNTFNPMKFLINLIVGKNESTGEELVDDIGVNNWFSVIADTYSFIPQAVWTQLTTMMVTVIGILIIAFIIRVVLDLL